MGCNLKAGVITVAIITIVFACFQLGKLGRELAAAESEDHHRHHGHGHHRHHGHHKHHGHHGHHHGHRHPHKHEFDNDDEHDHDHDDDDDEEEVRTTIQPHFTEVQDGDMVYLEKSDKKSNEYPEVKEQTEEAHGSMRSFRYVRIAGIVFDAISIITSCLMFVAVSQDVGKNQQRRHFLLPFIVWHIICVVLMIGASIFLVIVFHASMKFLAIPLILTVAGICVTVLFITLVMKYFRSLSVASGFTYAQMDDMKKPPLA